MSKYSHSALRGFAIPIIYYIVFGLGVGGGMALPKIKARMGIKDPKAERIVTLQAEVQKKDGEIKAAQDSKETAVKEAKQTIKDATQIVHQEVHGAVLELGKPAPNIETIRVLVNHADDSLTHIFGPLSTEQIAEINAIIDARAAGKIAVADALLAEKDKRVNELAAANQKAEATIVANSKTIATLETEKAVVVTKLNTVTADVVAKTDALVAKARELTGWGAWVAQIKFYFWLAVGLYLFVHFLMPSIDDELDKHYPPSGPLPLWVRLFHTVYNFFKTFTCAH